MATKEIIHTNSNSSNGVVLAVLVVVLLGVFIAYQQGMFGNQNDVEINLPGGQQISGSVSE